MSVVVIGFEPETIGLISIVVVGGVSVLVTTTPAATLAPAVGIAEHLSFALTVPLLRICVQAGDTVEPVTVEVIGVVVDTA
jgi:hypothetical protein